MSVDRFELPPKMHIWPSETRPVCHSASLAWEKERKPIIAFRGSSPQILPKRGWKKKLKTREGDGYGGRKVTRTGEGDNIQWETVPRGACMIAWGEAKVPKVGSYLTLSRTVGCSHLSLTKRGCHLPSSCHQANSESTKAEVNFPGTQNEGTTEVQLGEHKVKIQLLLRPTEPACLPMDVAP